MRMLLAPTLLAALSVPAGAASLDVTAAYRMKPLSYTNLNLNTASRNNQSFILNDARLGIAVKRIPLEARGGEETSMDLGLVLRAIGVSGSSRTLSAPFDRAAGYYPGVDLQPFIENAYIRVTRLWGLPWETTFGRQNFRLGSGLLLDDDGAGFTGVSTRGELPLLNLKAEAFVFNDRNPLNTNGTSLDLFGFAVDLPTEGTWQLNQLFERDRSNQVVYGCSFTGNGEPAGCRISKAMRSFTSARYQISFGPMVFDGEAAMQKGAATPTTGLDPVTGQPSRPAPNHITYNGNAQVVRMKWKQRLYKSGEGIMRVSVARGSGDQPGTGTRDEAFMPSRGHRYNGLERVGFGDFFAATPYDAYGGNYSTNTANGLKPGISGIMVAGFGYTPPAYRGFTFDLDYFLYQADRVTAGPRTIGMEWDAKLRYPIRDQFNLALSLAYFKAGKVLDPGRGISRKYAFEVSGRF